MLKRLTIANYKSYYTRETIDFALPSEETVGLTIFVGKNNAGKSTLLNVLASAFGHHPNMNFDKLDRHPGIDPHVEIEFDLDGVDQRFSLSKEARAYFKKMLHLSHNNTEVGFGTLHTTEFPPIAYVPSRRPWEDTFSPGVISREMRNFEQAREAAHSRDRRTQRQLERLGDQLNSIIGRGEKPDFDRLLKRVLPELSDWTTDRVDGQDRIMYVSASGAEHAISDVGDGVASIFRVCFALHSYPNSVPILLDEPELSLHPDAQKRLYELLREHARRRQIVIATHSPHCVHWPDLIAGAVIYRVGQGGDGRTSIHRPKLSTLRSVAAIADEDKRNRKLFDYLAKEIFFNSAALFVEGQEDVHLISAYLEGTDTSLPLFAYGAGGAGPIQKWVILAREIGLTVAALYDHDKKAEASLTNRMFESDDQVLVVVSPRDDIRDKYDHETGALIKLGFFDKDWNIKDDSENEFDALISQLQNHLTSFDRRFSAFTANATGNVTRLIPKGHG